MKLFSLTWKIQQLNLFNFFLYKVTDLLEIVILEYGEYPSIWNYYEVITVLVIFSM